MSGSPRRCSRPRSSLARVLRRPGADPGRPVPRAQDAGGVRLHLPALGQEAGDRAPRPARLPARQGERDPARPARAPARPTSRSRLGIRACLAGQRVAVPHRDRMGRAARRRATPRHASTTSSTACERIPLLICDEVGYIPFDPQAANLMFMLVSRRYERASADRHQQQAVQRLGRDLRRRHRRRRDGRPARPPRRDPQPQRRQLPPQRPRPRTPPRPPDRRNRLTDTPSAPSPRAAERLTTRRSRPGAPPEALKATIAAQASPYGLGLRDDGRSVLTRPAGGSILNRRYGVNSQPALTLEKVDAADRRTAARPEEAVIAAEVFPAIARLPESFRSALVAVDVAGLSYREAARVLGAPEATITTRLYRARRRVARELDPDRLRAGPIDGARGALRQAS